MEVVVGETSRGESVECRRLDRATESAGPTEANVVNKHDHNIRRFLGRLNFKEWRRFNVTHIQLTVGRSRGFLDWQTRAIKSFFRLNSSNMNSAITAPPRTPKVSQLNLAVISVTDTPKYSDIEPEIMPIGVNMPDITKYARKLKSVVLCLLFKGSLKSDWSRTSIMQTFPARCPGEVYSRDSSSNGASNVSQTELLAIHTSLPGFRCYRRWMRDRYSYYKYNYRCRAFVRRLAHSR